MKAGRWLLAGIGAAAVVAAGMAVAVRSGVYDVSSLHPHTVPVSWLLSKVKIWSMRQRAKDIVVPDLSGATAVAEGETLYHQHCTQCHGAPGIAPAPVALGLTPVPPNLTYIARDRRAATIFWTVKNGIKSTGMPAWGDRMSDATLWNIVAFIKTMPSIVPAEYRRDHPAAGRMSEDGDSEQAEAGSPEPALAPSPERGRLAIHQYACTACHTVPGVAGADTRVGPPLAGMGSRPFIAGFLANTPSNMVRWLQDPPAQNELTAMPDLGVSEQDARDMAAYLSSLQ